MSCAKRRGLFITFEGGEGAGKTTLIERMAEALSLEGHTVVKTREPGGTLLGEKIRELLLQHNQAPLSPHAELCLFLASRAQHILEVIAPALQRDAVVLCDRFNDSSIAYQGAARRLGKKEVAHFCSFISQGLQPHLTLYLDVDPALGLDRAEARRAQRDRIEQENAPFHAEIRKAYLAIHREDPKRFHLLDASQPAPVVHEEAMKLVYALLSSHV